MMSNQPTLTKDSLRTLISEFLQEALSQRPDTCARNLLPKQERAKVDTSAAAIKAFAKAGFGTVVPNEDVLTYNRWLAKGYRVKPGEHAVRVKNLRLFHVAQVMKMTKAEHAKAMAKLLAKAQGKPAETPKAEAPAMTAPKASKATKKLQALKVVPINAPANP